uniref:Kunitz/Bovine pancreatic trypsin inhibitor domain protein n=1 Tax=Angiostrongylus cantonensis TaxID=6313 RepID=A0A158PC33_ANGCA
MIGFSVDPCVQNQESGVGSAQLTRFYFNKLNKLCEKFVYFGAGGNRNNFQTLEECQTQCPESPNPCAVAVATPLGQCTSGVRNCGAGNFCHVGASPQTTICCPKPDDTAGVNHIRWYFNPLTQQCLPCTYRGLQGNENNFLTRQECESSCLLNACKIGTPYRSQGVVVHCSSSNPTVCPAGHYCHIGAGPPTSVCCQSLGGDPCAEPWTKGEGDAALTRFYYDAIKRKCFAFNYFGTKGNQNNFLTKEQCEARCPVWINPCAMGQPILTPNQRPFRCHKDAPCSVGYYCHIGFDELTTACCPSQGDSCTLEVKEGIEGNENNFLLREHCEATCPVWVNVCPRGEPHLLHTGMPQHCDPLNEESCPESHWCHPG